MDQLDVYYRLNKAKNLGEWQAQLARMAIPSTNFVYADKAGNIAYVYNAAIPDRPKGYDWRGVRSEEHTSELQSLMRISYAVFCLKKKKKKHHQSNNSINK